MGLTHFTSQTELHHSLIFILQSLRDVMVNSIKQLRHHTGIEAGHDSEAHIHPHPHCSLITNLQWFVVLWWFLTGPDIFLFQALSDHNLPLDGVPASIAVMERIISILWQGETTNILLMLKEYSIIMQPSPTQKNYFFTSIFLTCI